MTDTQTTAAANKTTLTDRLELLTVRGEIVRAGFASVTPETARRLLASSTRLTWSEAGDSWVRLVLVPDGDRRAATDPMP